MLQHNIKGTDGTFFVILQPSLVGTFSVEQMVAEFLMNSVRNFELEFFPVENLKNQIRILTHGADGFSYCSTSKSSCWGFWWFFRSTKNHKAITIIKLTFEYIVNVIVVTWSTVFGQMLTFRLNSQSFYTRDYFIERTYGWTSLGRPKKLFWRNSVLSCAVKLKKIQAAILLRSTCGLGWGHP